MALPAFLDRALRNNPYEGPLSWLYAQVGPPVIAEHHRRLGEHLARELPEGARVLDVGSGPGDFLLALGRLRGDLRLSGIDPARSATGLSRARARREGLGNVAFLPGSAQAIPFESAYFDAAVSTGSYKHWPGRPAGLREVLRVVKPGASFHLYELDPDLEADRLAAVAGALSPLVVPLMRRFNRVVSIPRRHTRGDLLASGFALLDDVIVADLPLYGFVMEKPREK